MSDPAAILNKAQALQRQGRGREAIEAYRDLLAVRPGLADCWYNLGYLLKAEGRFDAALDAYAQALAAGVREPEEVHVNRAVIYSDHLRRDDAAQAELEAALALNPDYLPALLNLGNLCEERGDRDTAVACYERIVSSGRGDAHEAIPFEALARLAQLRPPSGPDDPLLDRLRQAASGRSAVDAATRANLLFSLGRAYDRLGLFDEAFAVFEQANRCARSTGRVYDRSRAQNRIDGLIAAFAARPADKSIAPDRKPPEPLFICGMFRSGSTLIEQALAAHPAVTAGGELDFFPRLVGGPLKPFPESAASLSPERALAIANEYRAHLQSLFPEARQAGACVTDKRPDNFLLLGLVKRLFPAAKIVHTVRDPLDNCLSVYFQHLDQRALSYSSELGDIAHWYGQYRRLMTHWREQFADDMFDFSYDAFVREPVRSLEQLLEFLGLAWDDRCLEFHRRSNTVKTASYWQVRQPLYANASGRWRNYRAHLAPLRDALREAGLEVGSEA